jgi:glycosyltransferase involved in cell wall biosynthesis
MERITDLIMSDKCIVSVCVICYNQEKYIEETLRGILSQKTNFVVELVISNDCSTDNTDNIINNVINNYDGKIVVKYFNHKKNLGMMQNFIFSLEQCEGKYIALCDGDDYWIDENKLQGQVHFLDNNLEFSLVHTGVLGNQDGIIINPIPLKKWNHIKDELSLKDSLYLPIAFTSTSLFRNKKLASKTKDRLLQLTSGDWGIWIYILLNGKAKFFDYPSAVYRMNVGVSQNFNWETNYLKRGFYLFSLLKLAKSNNDKKNILVSILYYILIYFKLKIIANKIKPKLM